MAYSAQEVHGVDEVLAGERFTLALWFTTDPAFDEDAALLRLAAGERCVGGGAQLGAR